MFHGLRASDYEPRDLSSSPGRYGFFYLLKNLILKLNDLKNFSI